MLKKKEICPAYISKINSNCEKQILFQLNVIIPYYYYKHYFKWIISRGITSKYHGDFYCLNCLHSFRTKSKLRTHEKVCKNKDFFGIVMPSEKDKILEFNQYMMSDKMPCIIYAYIEPLIKK